MPKTKNFNRENHFFSLCGLNCALCPMHLDGYCPGCGGGAGNQSCAIAKCSLQHDQAAYCFLCKEYPCEKYQDIEAYDSFITHQHQLRDMARAQEIGMDAYNKEQARKAEILQTLLSDYNDGRRKTFYCVAINLLPLSDINHVMKQLFEDASLKDLPLKEKAAKTVALFQSLPIAQEVVLKLRKKPVK